MFLTKLIAGLGKLKRCCSFFSSKLFFITVLCFYFSFLTYGIKFWGQAAAYCLQPLRVVQKSCIQINCEVDSRSHCLPFAKMLNLLMTDDLYNYCLLTLTFNIFLGDVCNAIKVCLLNYMLCIILVLKNLNIIFIYLAT